MYSQYKNSGISEFQKFAFSVDCVIFGFDEKDLKILLIKRAQNPYKDMMALPGNLVYPNEDLESSAIRVLDELTGIKDVFLEQVHTFGNVKRHPQGRVVTTAYYSLIKTSDFCLVPSSFASEVIWISVSSIPQLAFDHNEILTSCLNHLRKSVRTRPIGFELLPPQFTLTDLQRLYESILCMELDKRNFRKKILSMDILVDLDQIQEGVAHRPAKLYSFDKDRYEKVREDGFIFEI